MKPRANLLGVCVLAVSMLFWSTAYCQPDETDDQTLSPYFFVQSDAPGMDQLPLKSTTAAVNIAGVIADVQVTQVYRNEGKKPLEAIYVFPASTRAAVYGMKMTIGKRVIEATIRKREDARREYEQARDLGKSASLLEQQRPNVFQMNVANIMPGDEIQVELKYTELIVPTDRVYAFVYPTVVGPRYSNKTAVSAPPSETWLKNPYLHQGQAPTYTFDIHVSIAAGLSISEVSCPSHKVKVAYRGAAVADVALDPSETHGGNRDYILHYRLDGDKLQSGLLLFEGEKENFFLLMLQPPKRVTQANIPGREYIFVVDVSGSMHGFPLEISKQLLKNLIGNLRPTDRFNVLLFAGSSSVMSEESLPATPENITKAIQTIDNQSGGGGTELLPALQRALSLKKQEHYARTIVIATDGYVDVEEEVFDLIRNNLGSANIFAFGIGTSVNRHIIEGMAHVGMGEPFVIVKPEEAQAKAEHLRSMIASPVLTQVKVDFKGFPVYDVEPVSIPDVLAERPVIVFGKWRGKPQGTITLTGIAGDGKHIETIAAGSVKPAKSNAALQYLWARHRIMVLSDYNKLRADDKRIKEITGLGLTYNLLTAYTSFVAVDTEVRNKDGRPTTVKQLLPLPQGVSDYAVGGAMAQCSAPMPRTLAAEKREVSDYRSLMKQTKSKDEDKGASAALTVADVTVSQGLSKEAVRMVVQAHLRDLEKCIVGGNPTGKVVLRLTIKSDGSVKSVEVLNGMLMSVKLRQCIIAQMKRWRLPKTQYGRDAKATISLVS